MEYNGAGKLIDKEFTEKFIDKIFDGIDHSDIIWNKTKWDEIYGDLYVEHAGNEQLLPLIALYDIIILPIWPIEFEENKQLIDELGGPQSVILIEINEKEG